jgi:hypothetical protein
MANKAVPHSIISGMLVFKVAMLCLRLTEATSRWTCSLQVRKVKRNSRKPTMTKMPVVKVSDCWNPAGFPTYRLICGATTQASIRTVAPEPIDRKAASRARSSGTWVMAGAIEP